MSKLDLIRRIKGGVVYRRRMTPPPWPTAIAMRWSKAARKVLVEYRRLCRRRLHLDADFDSIAQIAIAVGPALAEISQDVTRMFVWSTAEAIATQTEKYQALQFSRLMRESTGMDVLAAIESDPATLRLIRSFAHDNAQAIMDLPQAMANRLGEMVAEGVESGLSKWEIGDALEEAFEFTEGRAMRIAHQQVGDLYAELDRHRQLAAGIRGYIWNTMRDDRVRPSHQALEGGSFMWDDPPSNERGELIIPGTDYGCRCWAEPDLSTMEAPDASVRRRQTA